MTRETESRHVPLRSLSSNSRFQTVTANMILHGDTVAAFNFFDEHTPLISLWDYQAQRARAPILSSRVSIAVNPQTLTSMTK